MNKAWLWQMSRPPRMKINKSPRAERRITPTNNPSAWACAIWRCVRIGTYKQQYINSLDIVKQAILSRDISESKKLGFIVTDFKITSLVDLSVTFTNSFSINLALSYVFDLLSLE